MIPQPSRDRPGLAVIQQLDGLVALKITKNGAVTLPPTDRPVIDAQGARGTRNWNQRPSHAPKQRVRARRHPQPASQPSAAFPTAGEADGGERVFQTTRFASAYGRDTGESFDEDSAWTRRCITKKLPHLESDANCSALPR